MSQTEIDGKTVRIKPEKDLIASMAEDFKLELLSLIDEPYNVIIIDLTGVKMVDSIGIGVICATHNSITKKGGQINVVNVCEDIYNALTTMRLHHHFIIEKASF